VYGLKTTAAFCAMMLIALAYRRGHHPFTRFGPANQVTTVRTALVAAAFGLVGEPPTSQAALVAIALGLVSTILDGVDGWLARRTAMVSDFGARFDMEVDAVLILALAVLVWRHEKAGAWVLSSGLLRYLFVAAGWAWTWMSRPLPQTRRARFVCVMQIVALLVALVPALRPPASAVAAAVGLLALGYSFGVDTIWLWRHAV
jgi:phosphatidylglycerophosphate synthase